MSFQICDLNKTKMPSVVTSSGPLMVTSKETSRKKVEILDFNNKLRSDASQKEEYFTSLNEVRRSLRNNMNEIKRENIYQKKSCDELKYRNKSFANRTTNCLSFSQKLSFKEKIKDVESLLDSRYESPLKESFLKKKSSMVSRKIMPFL